MESLLHKINQNRFLFIIGISLIIFLFASTMFSFKIFGVQSKRYNDVLYSKGIPRKDIMILSIDDNSLQNIGRWPWNRSVFAEVIKKAGQSKVIGIDISFFEKSKDDNTLIKAINNSKSKIVLASEYSSFSINNNKIEGKDYLIPAFESKAINAYINLIIDKDGVVREYYPDIKGNLNISSFSKTIAELATNKTYIFNKSLLINYKVGKGEFRTISLADFLEKNKSNIVKNKIVLIGATAPDLHDDHFTPISKATKMNGIELHANAIQMLINNNLINNLNSNLEVLLILATCLAIGLLFWRFNVFISLTISLLLIILLLIISKFIFNRGVLINIFYPSLAILLEVILLSSSLYFLESHHKKKIKSIFEKYVSKEIVNEILRMHPKEFSKLKGKKGEVTVLFADLRGFTSMSEKLSPEEVVHLLNSYFDGMTKVIFKYKGTIDKFVGDQIMALWNTPLKQKDHALLAVKSALEMVKETKKVGKNLNKDLRFGIGINTGDAIIGNLGSSLRMEYTAIGDSINLGARLCSKAEGNQIIIGESTYKLIKDKILAKSLGEIKVKGKRKPVKVYQAIGIKDEKD